MKYLSPYFTPVNKNQRKALAKQVYPDLLSLDRSPVVRGMSSTLKNSTKRTTTTKPWEVLKVAVQPTHLATQFAIEQKVEFAVARLDAVGAWSKVEYYNNKANILASNGQKVRVVAV